MDFDDIARRAGGLRHDGRVAAGQQVQQRGLAGVGRPDDGDVQALAQALAAAIAEMGRDLGLQARDAGMDFVGDAGRQVLVGKVDGGFEMGKGAEAKRAPILVEAMQRTIHLLQRLAALLIGLGGDEVGDGLGLGEVELAVLERAARELAGLGQAAEAKLGDRVERAGDHGAAAMQVQLGHGLAGLAVGRLEPHGQAAVDGLAAPGIDQAAHHHAPRLGQRRVARRTAACEGEPLGEEDQRLGRTRAAQPNDRDRPGMRPRRHRRAERIDRGLVHQVRRGWPAGGRVVGVGVAPGGGRATTLSAILSYSASGISRRSTRSVLALNGRARMMASARTSPMPSRVMRSSRLALLMSMRVEAGGDVGRVWPAAVAAPRSSAKPIERSLARMSDKIR